MAIRRCSSLNVAVCCCLVVGILSQFRQSKTLTRFYSTQLTLTFDGYSKTQHLPTDDDDYGGVNDDRNALIRDGTKLEEIKSEDKLDYETKDQNYYQENDKPNQSRFDKSSSLAEIGTNKKRYPRPPNTFVGFVHLGKTGGSTVSIMLRNGCHSFVPKPCHKKANVTESALSILSTYYHVPDFNNKEFFQNIQKKLHQMIVMTVRDPFDRIVSTYQVTNPEYIFVLKFMEFMRTPQYELRLEELKTQEAVFAFRRDKIAKFTKGMRSLIKVYKCFPTLEDFASRLNAALIENNGALPARRNVTMAELKKDFKRAINRKKCKELAASLMGQPEILSGGLSGYDHFKWNFRNVAERGNFIDQYPLMVIRTEHLEDDWISVNQVLDPQREVPKPEEKLRNTTDIGKVLEFPIKKEISQGGREVICQWLKHEYAIYMKLIDQAVNLSNDEKEKSLEYSREKCPQLDLTLSS